MALSDIRIRRFEFVKKPQFIFVLFLFNTFLMAYAFYMNYTKIKLLEMEFKEFEPRFKSAKTWFKLSAGLNLETFDTIVSGTHNI